MNDRPEEKSKPTHQQGAARILELADSARGEEPGEFQGYHHGAGVSFIVAWEQPGIQSGEHLDYRLLKSAARFVVLQVRIRA